MWQLSEEILNEFRETNTNISQYDEEKLNILILCDTLKLISNDVEKVPQ